MREIWTLLGLLGIGGCAGIPEGIEAVKGFDVQRYLGKWYEIARFDHSFERGSAP
jgi:apolipoprotein D and lipocalin family protein